MTAVALRPFVRALGALEPEVARALSPWLPRLSLLVGSLARTSSAGGDPDGYEGVTTRGRYERLLLSEWAVALELPDEFVRRAVMSEHLFVEVKRREPQGALHSVVLVDPGPDQLGAPRLLHLAAAIVGEARARAAKAAFAWGATTEPVRLFSTVDPESAHAVLDARRAAPLTTDALARWHAAVRRFDAPWDDEVTPVLAQRASWRPPASARRLPAGPRPAAQVDVLFVGGAHLERLVASSPFAGEARVLRVDQPGPGDDARDGGRALEASLRPSARPRPVRLPLPDDAVTVRALRDPFGAAPGQGAARAPLVDVVVTGGLVVPLGARRVLVRTASGVAALVSPNSPRATVGAPRRLDLADDDAVLAAGMVGKRMLVLVRDEGGLAALFGTGSGRAERFALGGEVAKHLEGDPITARFVSPADRVRPLHTMAGPTPFSGATPVPMPGIGNPPRAFLDDDGTSDGGVGARGYALVPLHRRVVELAGVHLVPPMLHKGEALTVQLGAEDEIVVRRNAAERRLTFGRPVRQVFLGAFRAQAVVPGVLAIGTEGGLWVLARGVGDEPILAGHAPAGVRVVGAAQHASAGPVLLGVEHGRRLVCASKVAREDDLFAVFERHAFASEIVEVKPDLEAPQVAVLTADGTVTMVFLKTGARVVLCRRRGDV